MDINGSWYHSNNVKKYTRQHAPHKTLQHQYSFKPSAVGPMSNVKYIRFNEYLMASQYLPEALRMH